MKLCLIRPSGGIPVLRIWGFFFFLALILLPFPVHPEDDLAYQVKAGFVYHFVRFTRWPDPGTGNPLQDPDDTMPKGKKRGGFTGKKGKQAGVPGGIVRFCIADPFRFTEKGLFDIENHASGDSGFDEWEEPGQGTDPPLNTQANPDAQIMEKENTRQDNEGNPAQKTKENPARAAPEDEKDTGVSQGFFHGCNTLLTLDGRKMEKATIDAFICETDTMAADSHILYICGEDPEFVQNRLLSVHKKPVLTIGEMPGFVHLGGIIGFFMENNRLRFQVNVDAAKRSGLKFSSQLLMSAKIYHESE